MADAPVPADTAARADTPGFGDRLARSFERYGQLCVGIDPHPYLLEQWGLADSADGVREFGLRVVDAAAGRAGIVKPQVAFFERHGSAGFAALEQVLAAARATDLLVIADAKRGDLGTSVEAYAQAWLTPGSPLEADAMTMSAFQGVGSLRASLELAVARGKGVFVLAATSNPESAGIQTAVISSGGGAGRGVAAGIVEDVAEWNANQTAGGGNGGDTVVGGRGSIGVVLGATVDFAEYGIDLGRLAAPPTTPVLAPGFGHQGARYADLADIYGVAAPLAVLSASRSILGAGPDGIVAAVEREAREVIECRA